MKSRDAQIRMKRFQIEERRRQVGQIETMIEEFGRMVGDLDIEIAAEHRRTGIDDEKHFAYSTFARAARQRRTNLQTSIADLGQQLETAKAALDLAMAELQREEEKLERETGPELVRQAPDRAAV
jgi:flagellar FliJ protein